MIAFTKADRERARQRREAAADLLRFLRANGLPTGARWFGAVQQEMKTLQHMILTGNCTIDEAHWLAVQQASYGKIRRPKA